MDRTDELIRSALIYGAAIVARPPQELTAYTRIAVRASTVLDGNEELVLKMESL